MSSDAFDFEECLTFGKEWEKYASEQLSHILTSINIRNVSFDENPDIQRAGIDSILAKKQPTIDIKTQSHEYTKSENLPIETVSVIHKDKPGWFYESDADMVVWIYPNEAATNCYHTGYFMPLNSGIREWFDERREQYKFKKIHNDGQYGEYYTGIRLVPIEDFPDEYLVEFDPRIPEDKQTPEYQLAKWLNE